MPRTKNLAKTRSDSKVNIDELEKLCSMQCTQEEIAAWFGMTRRALEMRAAADVKYERKLEGEGRGSVYLTFREIMDRGYARGRISLRRAQMKLAEEGNATMGIWLGKQLLNPRDNIDTTLSAPGGGPITVSDDGSALEDRIDRILARARSEQAPQEPQ